jgi:glutathione S-transferase
MDIVLCYAPIACSLVPYVTLTEAKAKFTVHPINLRKGQQNSPDYLRLNPKHKVPLLVIDGKPLTENVTIQQWIARNFPAAKLLPTDPWQELQAISVMSWCASGIHPVLSRVHAPVKICDTPGSEGGVRRMAQQTIFEAYKIADAMLAGREFFFDHFTAADAHFFWCFRRGYQFEFDLSEFANCAAHFERIKARASVQQVLAFEEKTMAEFAAAA